MKTFVGIDLGSTTTKAVLLDENSEVIGRGITNSRSNYGTAARVAERGGARRRPLHAVPPRAQRRPAARAAELDEFLGALERAFRLEQFLEQLDDLEQTCRGQVKGERFAKLEAGVREALGEVFERLRGEAPALFAPGRQAQVRLLPRHRRLALSRATPRRSRARRACPTTCCSTSTTSRSSRWRTGRRRVSSSDKFRRALGRVLAAEQRGQDRLDRRADRRSSARSPSISRKPIWSAPATAA